MKKLLIGLIVGAVIIVGALFLFSSPAEKVPGGSESQKQKEGSLLIPTKGNRIVISDCKADPEVLEVREGNEVILVNSDDVAHTLFIDNKNYDLAAKGELKLTAKFSLPAPITVNFMCDDQSLPLGGAIYITK